MSDSSCPRCAELTGQIAELHARLVFRPCAYTAPGAVHAEIVMPGGRVTRGTVCIAHAVLLGNAPALAVTVTGEAGDLPCQWLIPAEETAMAGQAEQVQVPVPEEAVPADR